MSPFANEHSAGASAREPRWILGMTDSDLRAQSMVRALDTPGVEQVDVSRLVPDQNLDHHLRSWGSRAPEAALMGICAGAILGAALGWVLTRSSLPSFVSIPEPAGLWAALAGVAVGGTLFGLVAGLLGLGAPTLKVSSDVARTPAGEVLVTALARDPIGAAAARRVFVDHGAAIVAEGAAIPDRQASGDRELA
jgi:hypothetical protein